MLIIGPKTHTSNNLEHCLTLDGCSLNSSSSVRNLGVLFDSNLSFDRHISKSDFFHFKNISKLRPMLSISNAEMLIHAFMTSRLDYCNALLGGSSTRLINKLQMVQNASARVISRTNRISIILYYYCNSSYKTPDCGNLPSPCQTLATFLEELDRLLSSFMEDGTPLFVFGDFQHSSRKALCYRLPFTPSLI